MGDAGSTRRAPRDAAESGGSAAGEPPSSAELATLREKAELYDRYIARYQEAQRERNQAALRSEELADEIDDVLRGLAAVADDFERAIAAAETGQNFEAVLAGLRPVARHLASVMAARGAEPIPTVGALFDADLHQTLEDLPSGAGPLHVARCLRAGWRRGERILRRAIVEVEPGS